LPLSLATCRDAAFATAAADVYYLRALMIRRGIRAADAAVTTLMPPLLRFIFFITPITPHTPCR